MDTHEITKYLDIAQKRKYWIIIPFLATLLGGLVYALVVPRLWEAETLILVQAQSVPESYVQPIVSEEVDERLKTIGQQVTSRTNLESIIAEFKLSEDGSMKALMMEDKVGLLRKRINIGVNPGDKLKGRRSPTSGTSTFTIVFAWEDPRKAMQVANALASNFISENLKVRETQALGTSTFLAEEVASIEKRLKDKEEELKVYREKYMGGLPSQLDGNIKMIEGLQVQLERINGSIRDRENRRLVLQGELSMARTPSSPVGGGDQRTMPEESRDLATLKSQLAGLEAKYTPSHPDVIRLKKLVEGLESKEQDRSPDSKEPIRPRETPADRRLGEELRHVESDIRSLRSEGDRVASQLRTYQKWVEETPRREQELFSLNRDYDRLKEIHSSLLKRKLEAEIAVSMEKKQKGEQFRVIDPAKLPTRPVKPDFQKIVLAVLALGVGLGCGLAYVKEMLDTSYKNPEEIEKELKLPILVSVPYRRTADEIKAMKRKELFKAAGVAAGFAASVVVIFVAAKGVGGTMAYIKGLAEQLFGP
jgi:polysaccharide chain length determinant protein (PEP-CTERM system associated)